MPRVKAFNEEEVLDKAMQLFWQKGYHATSMQDLVNSLGINRASLYDTYGGKKELFEKAFQLYRTTNEQRIRDFLFQYEDVKEGLKRLFEKSIDSSLQESEAKGCFVVNTTTEFLPGDDEMQALLNENRTHFEDIFYSYLKEGVEKGFLSSDKDLKSIAALLFTLYNGLNVVAKVNPDKESLMSTVEAGLQVLN